MAQPIRLAAHDLSCQRGGRVLFQHLSFALGPGDGLRVSGPNGAGKTSLLRLIAGLLPMQGGRLEVGAGAPPLPELCHYVGHVNGIKSALSVSANTSFWAEFLEGEPARVEGALKLLGLEALADLPAGLLSAGQKRKLALTRLFVAPRPIWLLDEPSVSLDAASVKLLDAAIVKHLKSGGLAVIASHLALKVKFAHELKLGGEGSA
jgi:heme exporter protein A